MSSPRPSSPSPATPLELEVTVVSAKHLQNVNWRHGVLKPYAVVSLDLDPDRRAATKADESGSTKPVWNERLSLLLPFSYPDPSPHLLLAVDIYHSKPSETPKPLVGTARSPLKDLIEAAYPGASCDTTLELRRPSGRPQGKVRIKLAVRELPLPPPESNYPAAAPPPPSGHYYSSAPTRLIATPEFRFSPSPPPLPLYSNPVPPQPSYNPSGSYSDPYYSSAASGYYSSAGYYSAPPMPPPARPYERASSYGYGYPSAPVDYSSGPSSYEQKQKGGRMGMGTGLAVGAVAGALGGLALEEGLKHEEEKITERVESDHAAREDYSDYRSDY